jgi:hypothetical protein
MKIGIGKSRKFIIEGKEVRCLCQSIEYRQGVQLLFLRECLPPHNSFWYNPKTKLKV